MDTLVIAVHMIVAVVIIGLILIQQGKGAEMGASFGSGASNTMFGAQGSGSVFSRATAICTALFFVTSFWLALIAKDRISGGLEEGIPSVEVIESMQSTEEMPAIESDIPAAVEGGASDIPVVDDAAGDIPQ